MNVSELIRGHLLTRLAERSPWLLSDVQFALKKGAVRESLEAFGLTGWFQGLLEAHADAIEAALEQAGTGVLVSSGRHRLALLPFTVKDAELDWTPDPIGEDGWVYTAGRYAPPEGLVAPPAARVEVLFPVTAVPAIEEPRMPSLVHPWDRVAIKTGVHELFKKLYGHLPPEAREEIPSGAEAFPKEDDPEAARLAVDRAIAHAWPSGRVEEASAELLRRYSTAHREEIARAILKGPRVVAVTPDRGAILEPLIPFPERAEVYTPEGMAALAGKVATIQGILDLVREQKWTEKPFRVAYFTYPGDPLVPEAIQRIQAVYPESPLAKGLRGHGAIVDKPVLLLEHEDGEISAFALKLEAGVRGLDRQLYVKPKHLD